MIRNIFHFYKVQLIRLARVFSIQYVNIYLYTLVRDRNKGGGDRWGGGGGVH